MVNQGKCWIITANLEDASIAEKYVNALYWSIYTMTTVGFGDIKPQTTQERISIIFIMIISAGVYAYTINDVGKLVSNYNIQACQYK